MTTAGKKSWRDEPAVYRRIGTRTVTNTDWAVENKVMRTGPHQWTVLHLLCNKSWSHIRRFSSRKAAYADAGIES